MLIELNLLKNKKYVQYRKIRFIWININILNMNYYKIVFLNSLQRISFSKSYFCKN